MDVQKVWRISRTPLILLVLVAVVALGTVWAWREILKPPAASLPDPCVTQPIKDGKLLARQVSVTVENSGSTAGLAGQVARSLESQKFVVGEVGNATGIVIQDVVVVGYSVDEPEVKLVAAQFPNAEVRADGRMTDHAVLVVVGDDFSGMKDNAAAAISVDTSQVCLPALPSASPTAKG